MTSSRFRVAGLLTLAILVVGGCEPIDLLAENSGDSSNRVVNGHQVYEQCELGSASRNRMYFFCADRKHSMHASRRSGNRPATVGIVCPSGEVAVMASSSSISTWQQDHLIVRYRIGDSPTQQSAWKVSLARQALTRDRQVYADVTDGFRNQRDMTFRIAHKEVIRIQLRDKDVEGFREFERFCRARGF